MQTPIILYSYARGGTASTKLDAAPKPTASIPPSASGSAAVSSAPVVKEYIPPKPTPMDPYPGYYQRLSGEWAASDPEYYKTFWEQWQGDVYGDNDSTGGKGKRKNREWEGKEDQMVSADASEEAKKGQIAEREAKKNLTGSAPALAVVHGDAKPRMNIQVRRPSPVLTFPVLISRPRRNLMVVLVRGASYPHCLWKHMRTVLPLRRSLLRLVETRKKQETNTVRFIRSFSRRIH